MNEQAAAPQGSSFFRFMRSLRLAAGLIIYLAATGILATIIPQGLAEEEYFERYSRIAAVLIVQTGFRSFFSSILFLIPAILFFINLLLCTMHRFLGQLRKREGRRFGPDILHAGLLVLVIGGILTFSGRQEGWVTLIPGESVELPDGSLLRLDDFEYHRYADGRPEDWISTVSVIAGGGAVIRESAEIRVNHPLRIGGLSIYQASHGTMPALVLNESGNEWYLFQGDEFAVPAESASYLFMAPGDEPGEALLHKRTSDGQEILRVTSGSRIGGYTISEIAAVETTGLQAVKDPGYYLVVAAVVLIVAGLFITFYRRLGDLSK